MGNNSTTGNGFFGVSTRQQTYEVDGCETSYAIYAKTCAERNVAPHPASAPTNRGIDSGDTGPTFGIRGGKIY